MATALPEDVKKLIDGPNFAHLATIMPDGSPQSAPVWVLPFTHAPAGAAR